MAAAFNLTAQINLQGPSNIKAIVSNVQKQINGAKIKLNLDVGQNAAKNITSITTRLNSLSKAATNANANVATLSSTLASLSKSFNSASSSASTNANTLAQTSKAAAGAGKAIQQTRTQIEEFGKQSGLAVKRFAAFSAVTAPIFALTNAISGAFKEFINFNKEIVRLSQVTGQSVSDLSAVSKEITRLSTGLGVASSDLLTVATTLAQAGLSAEDTKIALEALAKSALAPSFDSLTDTTEGAIAALRQFGLQTRELDSALGSINAVAAAFAVEAGDIITAIQRTGGVFSAASRGVSEGTDALNEFIAIFTSVRATTRESAETIATGLRTIFTRIQRVKTIEQLREFGIELQDAEGKFVGLFEATRRLSEGLSRIDPRTTGFATISEELGGFRQIGKVIPLIQQFAVAEKALSVAQKGVGSTSKDALTAQQSLAVQFSKTRENFLALVREIGESTTFQAFVGVSFKLANGFINLSRALKPLLPLLVTFASIKAGGAIKEFGAGFTGVFGGGGGGAAGPGTAGAPTGGGGGGSPTNNTSAIIGNTNILNTVSQTLASLNTSILALNQNIVNTNSLLLNRPTRGFATGGLVPGSGNSDTFRANLTPGEFVIRKKAVEQIGVQNLARMNNGGLVQQFADGSTGSGVRKKKFRTGARSRMGELSLDELSQLPTQQLINYAKAQAYNVMSTGGSGMAIGKEFVEVPQSRIVPELEADLITYQGKKGFWREVVSPFGRPPKPQSAAPSRLGRASALEKQVSRQADEVAARSQQWSSITQGSAIDNYLISTLKDPILSDYQKARSGQSLAVPYHDTRLRQAVNKALDQFDDFDYSSSNIGRLVSALAAKQFAYGGLVQKFKVGSTGNGVESLTDEQILSSIFGSFASGSTIRSKKPIKTTQGDKFSQIGISQLVSEKTNLNTLSRKTGFTKDQLEQAQVALRQRRQQQTAQIISATESEQQRKEELLTSGKTFKFGLAGLRFGTTAEKQWSGELPPSFMGLESVRETKQGIPVQIFAGALSSSNKIKREEAQTLEKLITDDFIQSVNNVAKNLGSRTKASVISDETEISKRIENAGLSNVIGAALEGAIGLLGAPYIEKTEKTKSIDFPKGLGSAADLFNIPQNIPTDVTRTVGSPGKGITDYLKQIGRFFDSPFAPLARKASGGSISGQDTVPALLTPGEFVFNRKSAQRIGYGTLNKLNKADKVQGFNKGGIVGAQKFANGGIVDNLGGGIGAIAAISSIIIPEIEKLAGSFQKLGGESSSLAAGLAGAAKEASSLVLSTGIALRTLGADRRTTALAQVGVGVGGGLAGFITEKSAKDLEKTLLKTSEQFGKFDKTLQDLTQAPTEELRVESAARLEKTFMQLDRSVKNSITSIDSLEQTKNIGESLNNFSLSIITGISAMSALRTATQGVIDSAQLAVRASRTLPPGVSGPVGPAVSSGTKLLATFGKFIPYVGLAITAFSALNEITGFFTNRLQRSGEQLDRLYTSLAETTKNSNAYNLANKNFIDKILPSFRQIRATQDTETVRQRLGATTVDGAVNELNLNFKTLLKSRFAEEGFAISDTQQFQDFANQMNSNATSAAIFNRVLNESTKEFQKQQFIAAKRQTDPNITRDIAVAEFEKLSRTQTGRAEIEKVAREFAGAANLDILALRDLTDANNRVKLSLVNLDNVLISLSARINTSIDKTINSFDDLDLRISTLRGEPEQIGGRFLRRDIAILENIGGASADQISEITDTVKGLIRLPTGQAENDINTRDRFSEISTQVQAVRTFQQDLPVILRELQASNINDEQKITEILSERLGKNLKTIVGGQGPKGIESVNTIINESAASLLKAIRGTGEAITNFDDLARNAPALASALKNGESSVKAFQSVLEATAKFQDKLADQQKRLIDLNNELNQSIIQRTQTELQNSIELKRILGDSISLSELNNVFDTGIKSLTNVGGRIPLGGTTDVSSISNQLKASKDLVQTLDEQILLNRNDLEISNELVAERTREATIINRLTQSLNLLATSGDKTRNALDKIGESQNKFRTQRDIFFDFIRNARNPEAFLEQRKIIESIQAAQSGAGFRDIEQALLFQEKGAAILKGFRPEADVDNLLNQAADYIQKQTPALNLSDVLIKADVGLFFQRGGKDFAESLADSLPNFLRPVFESLSPESPRLALTAAQRTQREAAIALEENLRQQIGVVTDTTESIFRSFNTDLASILPNIIVNLEKLSDPIREQQAKLSEAFKSLAGPEFKKILSTAGPITAPTPSFGSASDVVILGQQAKVSGGPILSKEQINNLVSKFATEDPIKAIDEAIAAAKLVLSKEPTGPIVPQELTDFKNRILKEQETFKENQSIQNPIFRQNRFQQRQPTNPFGIQPNINRIQNTPQINDGASIQRFENSANNLAKSLNEAPIQNLSDSIGSFNTTATQLVSALKDFANKFEDGMKGEIAYTGDISLNFNEALSVNIPNNRNNTNSLISDLDNKLRSTIRSSVEQGFIRAQQG